MVIFGAIPGEAGMFRVVDRGRNQTYAQWVFSQRPSPHRVKPACERYESCGGCPLMHLDKAGQAKARVELLTFELQSSGLGTVRIESMVESPKSANFRHVVKLTTGVSDHGSPRIGAPGRRRHIVAIPDCTVITQDLRDLVLRIYHLFVDMDIRPFHNGKGTLRHVILRQSSNTGEILITIVAARRHTLLDELAAKLAGAESKVVGVHLHVNDEITNAILLRDEEGLIKTRHILGKNTIDERLAGTNYRVGPGDFFQTNPGLADLLYRDVLKLLALKEGTPLIDLYCGVGGFALAGAKITGWALGIEAVGGAVDRARASAAAEQIPAEFVHGEVEEVLSRLGKRLAKRRPSLVVNPARRGLERGVADAILALNPARIVYVSCSPRPLAKDLAYFVSHGLVIKKLTPYDMFPNSAHQEVVVLLEAPDVHEVKTQSRGPRRKVVR
jgi:23S rRNA (uracil1939-C5)-methyltransferase